MRRVAALLLASIAAGNGGCDRSANAESPAGAETSARGMSPEAYDRWRRPARLVAALDLREGDAVADVGAGHGYLTFRLAGAVGPGGRVTATDIDPYALVELALRAGRARGGAPVEVRVVAPSDPGLEPGAYDRILLAQVDHFLEERVDYLRRLRPALAPDGRVAVSNRIYRRAGLLRDAARAGYAVAETVDIPGQYMVLLAPDEEGSE